MAIQGAEGEASLVSEHELRRHQRVRLSLLGRFMLEDRREYPCQTIDISPSSCAFIAPVIGGLGERVIAYVDQIGRIEGDIARVYDGGFAMTLTGTPRRRDKLAAKLTWLVNRSQLDLSDDRRSERTTPSTTTSRITLPDGRDYPCRIVDLSLVGALLSVEARPPLGSPVRLGAIRATVVRQTEDGIAVEFAMTQTQDSLDEGIVAPSPSLSGD